MKTVNILTCIIIVVTLSSCTVISNRQTSFNSKLRLQPILLQKGIDTLIIREPYTRKISKKLIIDSVSVYYPVVNQCDSDPDITASMAKIDLKNPFKHRWIALSREMLKRWGGSIKYGDKIIITGLPKAKLNGVYTVQDCMNKRFKGSCIDILASKSDKVYGKWYNIEVQKI